MGTRVRPDLERFEDGQGHHVILLALDPLAGGWMPRGIAFAAIEAWAEVDIGSILDVDGCC